MWITTKCSRPAALSFFLIIQNTNYSFILISSRSFIKLCVLLCVGPLAALSRASCSPQTTLWKQSNRWPWAVCLRGVLRVKRTPVCCKRSFVVIILWLNLLTEECSLLITSLRQTPDLHFIFHLHFLHVYTFLFLLQQKHLNEQFLSVSVL